MKKLLLVIAFTAMVTSPALAAWVGDVSDVAPANKVVIQRTPGVEYDNLRDAYAAAQNGDTLLMGPGEWACDTNGESNAYDVYLEQNYGVYVNIIGSGSGNNPATDTILNGFYDANEAYGDANTYGGQRNFMSVFGSHGSAGAPMRFKDFRITGFGQDGISFGGYQIKTDPNATWGDNRPTAPGTGYVEFDNLFIRNAEDGFPGQHEFGHGAGWGCGIQAWMGDLNNVVVHNCKFDGKNSWGIRIAQETNSDQGNPNSYWHAEDWLIEDNIFTNMKSGVLLNAGGAKRFQIRNNEFTNMTEYPFYNDAWNAYGDAGIIMAPRGRYAEPCDGSIEDILIEGNYFADNGYVASDPNDPAQHPWEQYLGDILGECGIQAQVSTYASIKDVMIRDNTFEERVGVGGVMKSGIALKVTDYPTRAILSGSTTSYPGVMEDISLANNVFINIAGADPNDEDVEGTTRGTSGIPDPKIYPVNLLAGTVVNDITTLGDCDPNEPDGDIDVADIDATTGTARLDLITKAIKTSIADTNLDWVVNIMDLGNLADKYGQAVPVGFGDGDTNGDGTVDIMDLGNLADDYGKSFDRLPAAEPYSGSYQPPIPEPTTLALLSLGALMTVRRRR